MGAPRRLFTLSQDSAIYVALQHNTALKARQRKEVKRRTN